MGLPFGRRFLPRAETRDVDSRCKKIGTSGATPTPTASPASGNSSHASHLYRGFTSKNRINKFRILVADAPADERWFGLRLNEGRPIISNCSEQQFSNRASSRTRPR